MEPTEEKVQMPEEETPEVEAPETEAPAEEASQPDPIAELTAKCEEYLGMAQRIQAEFDNFRKRNQAARSEAWEDGARETVALILPAIDNLERALGAAEKSSLRDGVELIHKQLLDILDKRGVSVIDRVGEVFDPVQENAVMQADASEGDPGTVATVLQKGYRTASRVIRPAMVRVVAAE